MGGHATHDEREARETFPAELFEAWGRRDPIGLFEAYLMDQGIVPGAPGGDRGRGHRRDGRAAEEALASRDRIPPPEAALYEGFSEGGVLVGLEQRPV